MVPDLHDLIPAVVMLFVFLLVTGCSMPQDAGSSPQGASLVTTSPQDTPASATGSQNDMVVVSSSGEHFTSGLQTGKSQVSVTVKNQGTVPRSVEYFYIFETSTGKIVASSYGGGFAPGKTTTVSQTFPASQYGSYTILFDLDKDQTIELLYTPSKNPTITAVPPRSIPSSGDLTYARDLLSATWRRTFSGTYAGSDTEGVEEWRFFTDGTGLYSYIHQGSKGNVRIPIETYRARFTYTIDGTKITSPELATGRRITAIEYVPKNTIRYTWSGDMNELHRN